ncbi:MAG: endonuclease III [Thermoguttaceae bacterium]|nr:endonuclease III [Thermoguttaceae bacterium]
MARPQTPKQRAKQILALLKKEFPNASCTLDHLNPFQLAIATILSAQCTDKRVNMITGELFRRFPSPRHFAQAPLTEIENAIKSTGFYHNKAKNIQNLCRILLAQYHEEIPNDMETLVTLPGIGRKTANVIMGNAFDTPSGFVVDTHVLRLSRRLGLTQAKTPEKVEADLIQLFPQDEWINTSHRLILLGRSSCRARKPDCEQCFLKTICPKLP